jgi:hypothetical protein
MVEGTPNSGVEGAEVVVTSVEGSNAIGALCVDVFCGLDALSPK